MNVDGSNLTQLTHNSSRDEGSSWSPDGTKIVFHSDREGHHQLFVMNADGIGQTRLLTSGYWDEWPFWSPDGSKITFARGGDHGDGRWRSEVFVMNADGTNVQRLTYGSGDPAPFAWPSGWSPDGNQILFYWYREGYEQLYIMNADGGNQRKLTTDNYWNAIPTMSPDGTKIAFSSFRDNDYEVYVMNADGTGQTRLTHMPGEDWRPVWSPDGSKILFESERDGRWQLYSMNPDGGEQTRLTDNTANDRGGAWRAGSEECQKSANGLDTCDLEQGDILIQRATGLLYDGERALYGGYWGHTGMYYGDGQVIHSYPESPPPNTYPGVSIEPISATGFWTTEDWVVLRLKDQYDHENEQEALVYAGVHVGDPYNYNWLHPEYEGTYYCTSLVWRSYLEADSAIDLNTNTTVCRAFQSFCDAAVIPDDIYLSPFLDVVTTRDYKRAVFYLGSPADFYVTDPQGRHVGVDPVTGLEVNEMPSEAFYTGPDAELEFIAIVDMEGTWNVQVVGTDTGEYTFVTEAVDPVQPRIETVTGTTSPGQIDEYQVDYPSYSVYLPLIFKDY